jgi:DNA-binding NtrC family response regulator
MADGGLETITVGAEATTRRSGEAHLFVVEDGSSRVVPLPRTDGLLAIGRGEEMDLQLEHSSVSRRHARIVVQGGEIRVTDLGSHNGTRVNETRIEGAQLVKSGDVIKVGEVVVVVHAELAKELAPVILDEASWRRRLAEEVVRALQFQRWLSVLAIAGAELAPGSSPLRPIDVLGHTTDGMLAMLPEADPATARQQAGVVLHAVEAAYPGARIGIASCPADVLDADSLVAGALAAAAKARPRGIATIADTAEKLTIGGRTVVVCHPAMREVYRLVKRLAARDTLVLVTGENGAGKEHVAQALHEHSGRSGPFVAQNCAALAEGLVESILFGHAKGAFTGAVAANAGVFEAAAGGTLFLDELGELSLAVQAKLLRALETNRIMRVGETAEREIDVRIVAATNRVLEAEVAAGRFREDLYHRLAHKVHVPPLRERRCEIPILFRELLARIAERDGREPPRPTPHTLQRLLAHGWPGNVRELRNVAEYVIATVEDDRVEPDDLPADLTNAMAPAPPPPAPSSRAVAPMRKLADEITELERRRMTEALEHTGGVKTRAAALLGMPIRTFNAKFKQYGM